MSTKPEFVPFRKIDAFVEKEVKKGRQWFWDGWTLKIFTPHPRARTHVDGSFYEGKWGFINQITPTTKGSWVIPRKHLKPVV